MQLQHLSGSVQYNTPYINKEKLQWGFVLLYSSKQKYNTPSLAYTGSHCLWSSSYPSKLQWIDASISAHLISSCLVLGPNSLDLSALNNDYILLDIGWAALFGGQIEVVNRAYLQLSSYSVWLSDIETCGLWRTMNLLRILRNAQKIMQNRQRVCLRGEQLLINLSTT